MAALALGISALGSAQTVDPSRTIATVNGEAIKGGEFYHHMEYLPGVTRRYGDQQLESTPGFLALLDLIGQKLIYQLAKQKGVLPAAQEIQDELKNRIDADPKYVENWSSTGRTQADLEDEIRFQLTNFKLQTFGVTVTDQEVQKFYKDNPTMFTTPKSVKVRIIAVNSDDLAKAVDADLAAGKAFADVAKARSLDITKENGGLVGTVVLNYLPEDARTALSAIKIGQTTNWITVTRKDQDGKVVSTSKVRYKLEDVFAPKLQPLDKATLIATRRRIMIDKSRGKNDVAKQINDFRAKAKIDIPDQQYKDLYNQMVNAQGMGG